MKCKRIENLKDCGCSYTACRRRGICCECVRNHRRKGEIPACFFPEEAEKTYDRYIEFFIKVWAEKLGYKLVKMGG
ncbi:MAG: DUF6485 family protein [Desulfurobacteriaceae bacterium]